MCSFAAPPSPSHPTQSSVHVSCNPSIYHHVSMSCDQSICHPASPHSLSIDPSTCDTVSPSYRHVHLSHHSVCHSTCKSVTLSIHNTASPSIIPVHPSYDPSVHHPVNSSMTHQSVTQPVSSAIHP